MPPRSQKRRITSHYDAPGADGDAAATTVQKRVSPKRLSSASLTSSLSSIDGLPVFRMISPHHSKDVDSCLLDNVSPLCSPQRDIQQHKQAPGLHSPLQGRGTDSGPLVWVRVTKSGKPAPDDRDGSGESYWWPACVRQANVHYRADLTSHTDNGRAADCRTSYCCSLWGNLPPGAKKYSSRDALSISHPPLQTARSRCHTLQPSDVSMPRSKSSAEI